MLGPASNKPRLHVNVGDMPVRTGATSSHPEVQEKATAYTHKSVFRSPQMEVRVNSPSVKALRRHEYEACRTLPVFGDHDKVEGSVELDPQLRVTTGRLTISIEGSFVYISPNAEAHEDPLAAYPSGNHRHLFHSSSITLATGSEMPSAGSRIGSASSLREAFAATVRPRRLERRPSLQEIAHSAKKTFPFSFDLPRSNRPGEEMPPTFSTLALGEIGPRGRTCVERAEVEYKLTAAWESSDLNERARLEVPLLFQPDTDFQSLDGLALEPESWLEIPLRSDRPIPFKCAVTLPDPATFPRSASIPYFVVFTTKPRSNLLAREIAADATVAITLLRQVNILSPRPMPSPSLSHSPTFSVSSSNTSSSEESDRDRRPRPKGRLLRRIAKSASNLSHSRLSTHSPDSPKRRYEMVRDKPLPQLPPQPSTGVFETRTLQTDMCIGFPKRPRHRIEPHQRHPSLDAHASLPDGLYKGRMQLNKDMMPAIDWAGISVKYYLEVSVLFGQDELRTRVPVRIF